MRPDQAPSRCRSTYWDRGRNGPGRALGIVGCQGNGELGIVVAPSLFQSHIPIATLMNIESVRQSRLILSKTKRGHGRAGLRSGNERALPVQFQLLGSLQGFAVEVTGSRCEKSSFSAESP